MRDLRRLLLLCDLADLGTVTAVAERRGITSSAVSQQLKGLESDVAAVLLRRDGRTLRLTPAGETLVVHARAVLGAVDAALAAVAASHGGADRVTVSGFETSIPRLAAPLVARLQRERPGFEVRVRQADSGASLRALRQGEIDVAITTRLAFLADDSLNGLVSHTLMEDRLLILAPPRMHRSVRGLGLAALAAEPWITGSPGTPMAEALDRVAGRAGFTPQIGHRVVGTPNMCQLAGTGAGVALVTRLAVPEALEPLVVQGVELGSRSIRAVTREGARGNPAISLVLRTLRDLAREHALAPGPAALGAAS